MSKLPSGRCAALGRILLGVVRFPGATICRHVTAADVINEMGKAGLPLNEDLLRAIVFDNNAGDADAEKSLLGQLTVFEPEISRIVCAAIRLPGTDRVICGVRHYDPVMRQQIKSLIAAGDPAGQAWYACENGFVDQDYTFIGREEAMLVARAAGQVISATKSTELFSEDLY